MNDLSTQFSNSPTQAVQTCWYCHAVRQQSEMHQATLIPHSKQPYLKGPWWFCKDKPCASYAQFSLEG
jgi:hypothetical protein